MRWGIIGSVLAGWVVKWMQVKLRDERSHLKQDFCLDVWGRPDPRGEVGYLRILYGTGEYFEFKEVIKAPVGRQDVVKYSSSSFLVGKNMRDSAGAGRTRFAIVQSPE